MHSRFLTLLSFCSIIIAGLVKEPTSTDAGSAVRLVAAPDPVSPRALEDAHFSQSLAIKEPTSPTHGQGQNDLKRIGSDFKDQRASKFLNPEQGAQLQELGKFKQAQMTTVHQDVQELSDLVDLVQKERRMRYHEDYMMMENLKTFQEYISSLEKSKLTELGQIDSRLSASEEPLRAFLSAEAAGEPIVITKQMLDLFNKHTLQNFGNEMINHWVELLIQNNVDYFNLEYRTGQLMWEYTLKSFNFLSKYKFASIEPLNHFVQGRWIVAQLISYAGIKFKNDMAGSFDLGSHLLTDHWYWNLLNPCLKDLDKEEVNKINSHFLLVHRYRNEFSTPLRELETYKLSRSEDWEELNGSEPQISRSSLLTRPFG